MIHGKLTEIDPMPSNRKSASNEKIGRTLYRKNLRDERISMLGSGSAG